MYSSIYKNPRKKIKMVVIPYAGGSSQSFSNWNTTIGKDMEINFLDYPGHGRRIKEKLISDFSELIEDMVVQLSSVASQPVILFGHSMGGLISAYVAAEGYRNYGISFRGIIISSCLSPKRLGEKKHIELNDEQLEQYLIAERNIPADIIKTKEFKRFLFPAIKNDFKVLHKFQYKELQLPPCPIHCIFAEQDYDIDRESMKDWQECCSNVIEWHKIKGSHFYFEDYPKDAFEMIRNIVVRL